MRHEPNAESRCQNVPSCSSDIAEGVACMHYLKPPLLHRDLKVENVLITNGPSGKRFKLCDFGSASPCASRLPSTATEIRALEMDLNRHTTLQYRAPEMIDLYLRRPIDEKSGRISLKLSMFRRSTNSFHQIYGHWVCYSTSYATTPHRLKNMVLSRS